MDKQSFAWLKAIYILKKQTTLCSPLMFMAGAAIVNPILRHHWDDRQVKHLQAVFRGNDGIVWGELNRRLHLPFMHRHNAAENTEREEIVRKFDNYTIVPDPMLDAPRLVTGVSLQIYLPCVMDMVPRDFHNTEGDPIQKTNTMLYYGTHGYNGTQFHARVVQIGFTMEKKGLSSYISLFFFLPTVAGERGIDLILQELEKTGFEGLELESREGCVRLPLIYQSSMDESGSLAMVSPWANSFADVAGRPMCKGLAVKHDNNMHLAVEELKTLPTNIPRIPEENYVDIHHPFVMCILAGTSMLMCGVIKHTTH